MPSSGRTAARRSSARICASGDTSRTSPAKTGLLLDPYFSATKIAWLLDHVDGARAAAQAGKLAFGTIDSYLLWRLTGGKAHLTDVTNAARTLLFDIRTGEWDESLAEIFGVPLSLLPQVRDCAGDFGVDAAGPVRRADPHPRDRRRSAGRHHRAGLFPARHDEVDLWHRLFRSAQYRRGAGDFEQSPPHHHRLSVRRKARLCAGRRDFHRRGGGAMAARRAQDHRPGVGCRCARLARRSGGGSLSGAGLCRSRRAALGCRSARRDVRPFAQVRCRRIRPRGARSRSAIRRAICSTRCVPTGRARRKPGPFCASTAE